MPTGTVVITGASSGLGEEMARQFAALGYDLALCARRIDRLQAQRDDITAAHPDRTVEVAQLDVTDADAVRTVFQGFATSLGHVDRIVINAGLGKGTPLGSGNPIPNLETVEVNFTAVMHQAEAALEIFRAQESGHLVFISSIMALRGMQKAMATYAATKAAVASLAEGIRAEAIPGVKVTTIYPGYISSEMTGHLDEKSPLTFGTEAGTRAIVNAIEKRKANAYVPAWPYLPVGIAMKVLPLRVLSRVMK